MSPYEPRHAVSETRKPDRHYVRTQSDYWISLKTLAGELGISVRPGDTVNGDVRWDANEKHQELILTVVHEEGNPDGTP